MNILDLNEKNIYFCFGFCYLKFWGKIKLYFISKIDVFWNNLYILVMCLKFEFF